MQHVLHFVDNMNLSLLQQASSLCQLLNDGTTTLDDAIDKVVFAAFELEALLAVILNLDECLSRGFMYGLQFATYHIKPRFKLNDRCMLQLLKKTSDNLLDSSASHGPYLVMSAL